MRLRAGKSKAPYAAATADAGRIAGSAVCMYAGRMCSGAAAGRPKANVGAAVGITGAAAGMGAAVGITGAAAGRRRRAERASGVKFIKAS